MQVAGVAGTARAHFYLLATRANQLNNELLCPQHGMSFADLLGAQNETGPFDKTGDSITASICQLIQ